MNLPCKNSSKSHAECGRRNCGKPMGFGVLGIAEETIYFAGIEPHTPGNKEMDPMNPIGGKTRKLKCWERFRIPLFFFSKLLRPWTSPQVTPMCFRFAPWSRFFACGWLLLALTWSSFEVTTGYWAEMGDDMAATWRFLKSLALNHPFYWGCPL